MKTNLFYLFLMSIIFQNQIMSLETNEHKTTRKFNDLLTEQQILAKLTDPMGVNYIKDVSTIISYYATITDEEVEIIIENLHNSIDDCNIKKMQEIINFAHSLNISKIIFNGVYDKKNPLELAIACRREAIQLDDFYKKEINSEQKSIIMELKNIALSVWKDAKSEYLQIIEKLIDAGANINDITTSGKTILIEAVIDNQIDLVKMLIDKGVCIDVKDLKGLTALQHAELLKNEQAIKLLT